MRIFKAFCLIAVCALIFNAALDNQKTGVVSVDVIESETLPQEKIQLDQVKQREKESTDALIRKGAIDLKTLIYCKEDEAGKLQIYNQPIRVLEDGVLKEIVPEWLDGKDDFAFETSANTIKAKLKKTGEFTTYSNAFEMTTTPAGVYVDDVKIGDDKTTWELRHETATRVALQGPWPLGIYATWNTERNRIKENVVLPDSVRELVKGTKTFGIASTVASNATLVLSDDHDYIDIRNEKDEVLAQCTAPRIKDSAGAHTFGTYEYDGKELRIVVSSEWLEDTARVYPVYVDPTTQNADTGSVQACGASGASGDVNRAWLLFNLPPINGSVSNVDLVLNLPSVSISGGSISVDAATSATGTSWTGATACATMDGFTYYSTSVSVTLNIGESTGTKTWANMGGTTNANSIVYQYDDGTFGVCDPGNMTVRLKWATSGTTNKADDVDFLWNSAGDEANFDSPSESIPPYLSITYSGTLSCSGAVKPRNSGGSVGLING